MTRKRSAPVRVMGVDGTRGGWISITLLDGRFEEAAFFLTFAELIRAAPRGRVAIIGVDIPIGLPTDTYGREAESHARDMVKPLSSSVFSVCPLVAYQQPDYQAANRALKRLGIEKRLTQQSFRLGTKICEVDRLARRDARIFEVHPEVSFCALAGRPLTAGKKTWAGQERRQALLRKAGIRIPARLPVDVGTAAPDDILDAAVAAWSAHRIATNTRQSLPPDHRRLGAIWY